MSRETNENDEQGGSTGRPVCFLEVSPSRCRSRAGSRRRARSPGCAAASGSARSCGAACAPECADSASSACGARPTPPCSRMLCVTTLPACCASTCSRRYSLGESTTRAPSRKTARAARSIASAPSFTTGSPRAPRAWRRSAVRARGEQLRHAERLHHIVVGAGFQQPHLVVVARPHREHDDRHRRPDADALQDARAVHVRQIEVEHDQVELAQRRGAQPGLAGLLFEHGEMLEIETRRAGSAGSAARRR